MKSQKLGKTLLGALMTLAITGSFMGLASAADAPKENLDSYSLDQLVVTATRTEKRDVDVPASTEILTKEDIKASGATNVAGALSKVQGMAFKSFGPNGASMGTMINEASIRGIDNGTIVMVNGNPISWRGKYNLDAIPAESVEKIEIVKGGGSVLYGSEGMAGVINIITKKTTDNTVHVGFGNYGQKTYGFTAGDDKFGVTYNKEKWDGTVEGVNYSAVSSSKKIANTRTDASNIRKENLGLSYNVNDNLSVGYNYYETKANYDRIVTESFKSAIKPGDQYNGRLYTTKQHLAQINYDDDSFKAHAFFNTGTTASNGPTLFSSSSGALTPTGYYNTREKNTTFGLDTQKKWAVGDKANAILGANYKRESYQQLYAPSTAISKDYSRNNWALFGQWDQSFDDKNEAIISARETWTTGAEGDQNFSNFSASGQFIHKLDDANNLYASVGQSFIMPTFAQMYGASDSSIPNPGLKPQKGVNYEIGWKQVHNQHSWKAALYRTTIKDNISASWDSKKTEYQYTNEDFKNTGVELSVSIKDAEGPMSYKWGIGYSNPQSKSDDKGYWDRKFGRVQLTGGIGYQKDKLSANLTGSFLADRVQTPSKEHSFEAKPYFLTTLSTTYSPDKHSDITLTIDNMLNREDIVSHSSSSYYSTPINFMVNYTYKF